MYRYGTTDEAKALIQQSRDDGIDEVELIRRLLLRNEVTHPWYPRQSSEGAGRIRKVEVRANRFVVTSDKGIDYEFFEMHGYRWRENGGPWISRSDLESELGAWPGYIDALEDVFHQMREFSVWDLRSLPLVQDLLREQKETLYREFQRHYDEFRAETVRLLANERHPELKAWRSNNPVPSTERPEMLRNIRNVKRLEISHPCHVYFLLKSGEVVYVGQTSAAWPNRILQHLKEREGVRRCLVFRGGSKLINGGRATIY